MSDKWERRPGRNKSLELTHRLLALIAAGAVAGCASSDVDDAFPLVIGASSQSDHRPCTDYASYYTYAGTAYYVVIPETKEVIRRHKGMDFCTASGAEVIAAANGTVMLVDQDNPHRGGRVTIRTLIEYKDAHGTQTLFVDALHITPRAGLKTGDVVRAGQVIGVTQPPGKVEIGTRSHVHFTAAPVRQTWTIHTDPNQFWQKGSGVVSCFKADNPPSDKQIVAPIKC